MRILLYLAVWKRPEITEICFMGINRLRSLGVFDVDAFAVISEESMKPLCNKYEIDYCFYKNIPLGEKKNFGLTEAIKKDWDYLIELGSDDLIKNEIFELYRPHFGVRDLLSLSSLCLINSATGECKVSEPKSSFGLGRAISKDGVVRASIRNNGYQLWNNTINSGLDNDSNFKMAVSGVFGQRIHSNVPVCIDIKSDVNIHSFSSLNGIDYPIEWALDGLSGEEINSIESLCFSTKNR